MTSDVVPFESELLNRVVDIPEIYNQYFTKLSEGKPKAPDLPAIPTPQELGEELMSEVPDDFDVDTQKLNDISDVAKIGFAYIKLMDETLAARFSGIKRINTLPQNDQ